MKKVVGIVLFVLLLTALAGCGQSPASAPEPTPEPTPSPAVYDGAELSGATESLTLNAQSSLEELVALAGELPGLNRIDFGARQPSLEELELLRGAFPQAELVYSVSLAGQSVPGDARELDLSALSRSEAPAAAEALKLLPELESVKLGAASEEEDSLRLEDVGLLQAARPEAAFDFSFELWGKTVSTADETLDLSKIRMNDGGQTVREALPYMTRCKVLDMDSCGVSNEDMAAIRDDFPDIKVIWRVYFGPYNARTDETKILASIKGYYMRYVDVEPLKYCTEVKYLDLGHNNIEDISFVSYMPDLEVAILAINYWSDASPLADCPKLEYLEIFNTQVTDLTPLAGLTNLKHLNICFLHELKDITPLYGLTGLERLWIGSIHSIPQEQLDTIREKLPNTEIDTTAVAPIDDGWRTHERYKLLSEQFGYEEGDYSM